MNEEEKDELLKLFLSYQERIFINVRKHPEYDINKNNNHLFDEDGKTALKILKYMGLLNGLVDDLKKIVVFMRRFPDKKYYLENDIDQLSYLKYHYEVFIHKIHTILEVKKLSLNDVYKIGLLEKDCSWSNLKGNPKIRTTETTKIIEAYFETFVHLINHRNLNTHRAIFIDNINERLSSHFFLQKASKKYDMDLSNDYLEIFPQALLDYQIAKYRKEKTNYVKDGLKAAETYVDQFNSIMISEFLQKILKKNKR